MYVHIVSDAPVLSEPKGRLSSAGDSENRLLTKSRRIDEKVAVSDSFFIYFNCKC